LVMNRSQLSSPSGLGQSLSTNLSATSNGATQALTSAQHPVTHPRLASLADAGLKASNPHHSPKKANASIRFEVPTLTGAAAMADEQRLKEEAETERQRQQVQSPNPALTSLNTLRGGANQGMSSANDASRLSPLAAITAPSRVTTPPVADAMHVDQASPTSMSSHEGLQATLYDRHDGQIERVPTSKLEDRSNKALTYPPQPPAELPISTPARGMSLPNAESRKSSSIKKHRCPHCSTEFTRHHNLKSHLLTHSQEKPYGCQQCSAKFRRLHDLKRHTKLHTGERPHTCNKCGRKFARGDALARHNKGPGGCAGRRGSFDDDDGFGDAGSTGDDGMEDVVYANHSGSRDHQDASRRRRSEPGNQQSSSVQSRNEASPTPYRQHSSTYPGVAAMSIGARVPQMSSSQQNPRSSGPSYSSAHFNGPTAYSQGGITESPRPLSPAQLESQRQPPGHDNPLRDQAAALAKPPLHQQMSRGVSQAASPIGLPPMNSQGPQLPPLSGIVQDGQRPGHSRNSASSSMRPIPPPIVSPHPFSSQGPNSANSNTGSFSSSHHQSSGGSLREHLGSNVQSVSSNQPESDLFAMVQKMKTDINTMQVQHSNDLGRLQEENNRLKAQLEQQQRLLQKEN
ncbi:MAG: hypothetical protein M1828_006749, partial [Chrysothrix sp. TS-e1954]